MNDAIRQLDQRFKGLKPLLTAGRPAKGWIRAVRNALGLTSTQMGQRLGVAQSRVIELEKAEMTGQVTLHSLDRAAQALGCRFVYAIVPESSLAQLSDEQARRALDRHWKALVQTMSLEGQAVENLEAQKELRRRLMVELLRRPSDKWKET